MEIIQTANSFRLSTKQATIDIDATKAEKGTNCLLYSSKQTGTPIDTLYFDGPGEYEVRNSLIDAVDFDGTTGYIVTMEGMRVGYLPAEGLTEQLTENQLERFHDIDIVLLPVLDDKAKSATKIISQLEPTMIVPYASDAAGLKQLQAEFGENSTTEDRLRIAKKDLGEVQRMVCLKG